jgi:hypothetical protein
MRIKTTLKKKHRFGELRTDKGSVLLDVQDNVKVLGFKFLRIRTSDGP